MTDLQTSLIIVGSVIVVGVISYNKWQEHKARKLVERAFSSGHDDVLMHTELSSKSSSAQASTLSAQPHPMSVAPVAASTSTSSASATPTFLYDGGRLEPALYERPKPTPQLKNHIHPTNLAAPLDGHADLANASLAGHKIEAGLGHVQASINAMETFADEQSASASPAQIAASAPELPIDELIDCIIPIALELSVRGEKILSGVQNLHHAGSKTVHFVGRTTAGVWEPINHGSVYGALLAGVQLVNRNNALNALEYSEFIMRLREFTDTIGAEPEVPDMMDVMKTAQALHQFIMDHDVQLGVNVRSSGAPWNVASLLAALTRQGFDRRADGHLVMQDGEGEVLFFMSTNAAGVAETTDRLTLLLDVPRVGPARDGYGAMIACARSLAMRLGGTVVDDNDQLLSDAALSDIAEQVSAFYSAMEAAEIPAGSKRALRLFS